MEYDYIVVGAGPSGLTLSYLLAKKQKRVLLLERESTIGGCHRVTRVTEENLFSDHGPRVYSHSYVNFKQILRDMNMNFDDFFVKYRSSFIESVNLNIRELSIIIYELMKYMFLPNYGRNISMKQFCEKYNFSINAKDYIDLTCRLSDGADYSRYTLYQFLGLIEYQSLYSLYQPKKPLDEELFSLWEKRLLSLGVDIKTNSNVIDVSKNKVVCSTKNYNAEKIILAIPLERISEFKLFKYIEPLSVKTAYIKYVHIMFHWNKPFDTSKIVYKNSPLGMQYIVQSKYTKFKESSSAVVISSIITRPELVKNLSKEKITKIIFDHLLSLDSNIPMYYKAILYPGNSKDLQDNWTNKDTSFVLVPGIDYIDFKSKVEDVFFLGPYNKYSPYPATTLEAAVANAIKLFNILEKENMIIQKALTLKDIILIMALLYLIFKLI